MLRISYLTLIALAGLAQPAFADCVQSGSTRICTDASGNVSTETTTGDGTVSTDSSGNISTTTNVGNGSVTTGSDASGSSWSQTDQDVGGGASVHSGTDASGKPFSTTCVQNVGCK